MAQKSTRAILLPSSPGLGPLLPKETLLVTDTADDSAPHRSGWKQYIRHRISKPSVEALITLAVIAGLYFLTTAISNLGVSDKPTNRTLAVAEDHVVLLGQILDRRNAEVVSVQWSLYGMGRYKLQLPNVSPGFNTPPNAAMDIYIDNALQPAFLYDPAEVLSLTDLGFELSSIPSVYCFRTEHEKLSGKHPYHFPCDSYSLSVSGFAIDKETNNSIPLSIRLDDSGAGNFDAVTSMLLRSTNFTRIVDGQLTSTEVDPSKLFSNITRSTRARALTYFLLTMGWLLTSFSVIITTLSFGRRGKAMGSVGLFPVAIILAIAGIRGNYPGSPPLGLFIDLVGFFPQIICVASCILVALAGFSARQENKEARSAI